MMEMWMSSCGKLQDMHTSFVHSPQKCAYMEIGSNYSDKCWLWVGFKCGNPECAYI